VGCVHPYIGKRIGFTPYTQWFHKPEGHHTVTMEHLLFDYDYAIKNDRIYFDGTISCNEKNQINWVNAEISIQVVFLDEDTVIQEVVYFSNLDTNEDLCTPKRFETDYPYNISGNGGVIFDYKVKMWQ